MGRHGECRRKEEERRQAACLLGTALLVVLITVFIVLYFTMWKPRDPILEVPSMQLLSLKAIGSGPATDASAAALHVAYLSLNLQAVLYNPNRGIFWVSDGSGACLYSNDRQLGFTRIAAGSVPAQALGTATIVVSSATPFIMTPVAAAQPETSSSIIAAAAASSNSSGQSPLLATAMAAFSSFPDETAGIPSSSSSSSSVSVSAYSSPALLPPPGSLAFQLTSAVTIEGHVSTANGLFSHRALIVCKCHITICFSGAGAGVVAPFIHSYYCDRTYSLAH